MQLDEPLVQVRFIKVRNFRWQLRRRGQNSENARVLFVAVTLGPANPNECESGLRMRKCAGLTIALFTLTPVSLSQSSVGTIIKRSVDANAIDWKAAGFR